MVADNTGTEIGLGISVKGSYPEMPTNRHITFEIHNVCQPSSVRATDGLSPVKIKTDYDKASRTLRLTTAESLPLGISIQFWNQQAR